MTREIAVKEPREGPQSDVIHVVEASNAATAKGRVASIADCDRSDLSFVELQKHDQ